jgi:uncharacterized protein (TIGR02271 family)
MATTADKRTTVVGVFEDRARAQQAVNELRRMGFREDQIGVASPDGKAVAGATEAGDRGTHAATGAAAGAATGAGLGALWGLGIIAGVLPAIGPAIAGGALASVLASAAAGAAAAGIVGALIGLGVPEEEARYYEGELKAGRTIVTVTADGRYDEACAALRRLGAYDMHTRGQARPSAAAGQVGGTVQLREEELRVHKQPVQTGEVHLRKEVHTEHRTVDVPVQKEEVVIERRPAQGQPAAGSDIRAGEEVRIPVKEEQVQVEKKPVVKEEVSVGKRKVQQTERVSGTVRKEEVKVEQEGDARVRDDDADKR